MGGISDKIVVDWCNGQKVASNLMSDTDTFVNRVVRDSPENMRSKQQADDLLGKLSPPPNKSFIVPPSLPPIEPEKEYIQDVSGKL